MMPTVNPFVDRAQAFPALPSGIDRASFLRLDLSESVMAAPPRVRESILRLIDSDRFSAYPDDSSLYPLLADYVGVPASQLLVTNGSDHAIQLILRAFLSPGDQLQVIDPSFPIYAHVARTLGADVQCAPLAGDFSFSAEQFIEQMASGPRLCVLVNPNNPTGTLIPLESLRAVAAAAQPAALIVDEAYYEYAGMTAVSLLADYPNVIITRTFSKAFGLAGLRLGYIVAHPDIIRQLRKLRLPFDVNAFAISAATGHLSDLSSMRQYVRAILSEAKPRMLDFLDGSGVASFPTAANFVLVELPERDLAVARLRANGVLVAPQSHPRLKSAVRIAIPIPEHLPRFQTAFTSALGRADLSIATAAEDRP
jgi:histidinol-phosphate aminotransferase